MKGEKTRKAYRQDDLLALTARRLMEAEGQQLLELLEELEGEPGAEPPPSLDASCLEAIRKKDRHGRCLPVRKALRILAAAALSAAALFITAFATMEEVQESTLKLLIQVTGQHTKYALVPREETITPYRFRYPSAAGDEDTMLGYRVEYLPEGYSLALEQKSPGSAYARYVHEDGSEIVIDATYPFSGFSADTANATVETVYVGNHQGQLIQKYYNAGNGRKMPLSRVVWGDTLNEVFLSVTGYRVNAEVVLQVAREMKREPEYEPDQTFILRGYELPGDYPPTMAELSGKGPQEAYVHYRINDMEGFDVRVYDTATGQQESADIQWTGTKLVGGRPARFRMVPKRVRNLDGMEVVLEWNDRDTGNTLQITGMIGGDLTLEALLDYAQRIRYVGVCEPSWIK